MKGVNSIKSQAAVPKPAFSFCAQDVSVSAFCGQDEQDECVHATEQITLEKSHGA
jgi:hypothetical protein